MGSALDFVRGGVCVLSAAQVRVVRVGNPASVRADLRAFTLHALAENHPLGQVTSHVALILHTKVIRSFVHRHSTRAVGKFFCGTGRGAASAGFDRKAKAKG